MNNVIGYKGTPEERKEYWGYLLYLRKSINWTKQQPGKDFNESLVKEKNLYRELYQDYVRAA